jgi:very-short-patch-repair endonuclease
MLVRGGPIAAAQVTTWFGTPVVAPARAVVDAARFDRRDGVMTADAALRDGLCTAAQLDAAIASVRTFPGVRRAAEVVPLASALAESPLESLVRLALVDDAFPSFELQVEISTRGTTYRVDALFRRQGLVLEMDGLGKYTVEELRREKMREARLRAAGYRVERVTWEDVMRFWPQTRARLWAALAP